MKKYFAGLLLVLGLMSNSPAQEYRVDSSGVYLLDYDVNQLQEEFKELEYTDFLNPADNEYPRIFVQNLPKNLDDIENKTLRNQLFMQIILPHVLKINDGLKAERKRLLDFQKLYEQNLDLDDETCQIIEEYAKKYDVVTPFKDSRRCPRLLTELIERVDAVPPSLVIGAAAIYTKWGTSRIAVQGNNLFKAREWYTDQGLEPIGEDPDEPYRYIIYPSLEESIQDYIHKINTNVNFKQFRTARRISHKRGDILYGKRLVWSYVLENNLTNYAGMLDYTITFYRLTFFDEAKLEAPYEFDN